MPEPRRSRHWPRHLATLAWMAGMWLLLTIPGESFAPAAELLPEWVPSWVDKPVHFLLFAILGWLLRGSLSLHLRPALSVAAAVTLGLAYGGLTEWWQIEVSGRSGELADLLANSLGTVVGVALRK